MPIGEYNPKRERHRSVGIQRDDEGNPVCVHCGERFAEGVKRRWHPECVRDHHIRSGGAVTRGAVFERDAGVCAFCAVDCGAIQRAFDEARERLFEEGGPRWREKLNELAAELTPNAQLERALTIGYSLWEADHIVPKAEGGAYTGLENLRTLCKRCHGRVTGELRKRLHRKAKRRAKKHGD